MIQNKKVLVVASLAKSLLNFRGDFIRSLIASGYSVYTAAPKSSREVHEKLLDLGVTPCYYTLQRTGLNPFRDLKTFIQLRAIIRKHGIGLVFPYTIKPVIYSSLAARGLKVPVVSLITGLGFTFSRSSSKAERLQKLTQRLYQFSLRNNAVVIFQNVDDQSLFHSLNLLGPGQKTAVVNGSGVNLSRFPHRVREPRKTAVRFAMMARLIREKGIHLYLAAAEKLKQDYPSAEFHVIGAPDHSSTAIEEATLEALDKNGIIVYHGSTPRVAELLTECDVFVLPSFYREGVPRSILEALSIGMPVITTDTPGCRETVRNGENGFLVEPRDENTLLNAMLYFLANPDKIVPMGKASRKMAEIKFDVELINKDLLHILNEVFLNLKK